MATSRLWLTSMNIDPKCHGLLNRWTVQYDWGYTTGWLVRIVNILQISHHIFIKLSVCTSMRVIVLRTCSILTLAIPYVKTEQIQNLALFWDCCKKPKSVISGNLSKNAYVWATQWPTSTELKIKFDPSLDRSWPEVFRL
jgi:hypothetical protein